MGDVQFQLQSHFLVITRVHKKKTNLSMGMGMGLMDMIFPLNSVVVVVVFFRGL